MNNTDDIPDPSPDDLTDLEETIHGRPLPGPAAKHLARMKRQRAQLAIDIENIPPEHSATKFAQQLREDLRDLELRIAEYQHQLGTQN